MIIIMGVVTHGAVNGPTPAEYAFEQGMAAYQRADYSAADQRLTEAINYGGKTWQTWYMRGRARQRLGDHSEALGDYRRADHLHPSRVISARLGDCYCRSPGDDFRSAIGAFRAAIEHGVEGPEVYNNLGVSFQLQSDFSDARKWFDLAIALAPDSATIYYNRATLEWQLAQSNQQSAGPDGLGDIDHAIALGLSSPDVLVFAARMYGETLDDAIRRRKALAYLAQAIELGADIEGFDQDPTLGALMAELRIGADFPELVAAGAKREAVRTVRFLDLPDDLDAAELAAP